MAIPKMEDDVEVIAALGDVPGSDNGLTPQQLKERFDLAAVRLKNYINNILLPELNMIVDVKALLEGIIDKTLSKSDMAADAKATADALAKKLSLSGGTMSGLLDMSGRSILNVATPTTDSGAVNKSYVDAKRFRAEIDVPVSGWSGSGPYTQSVSVPGILATDQPHFGPVYSGNWEAEKEAFALVDDLDTAAGSVTFTCFEEKPGINLTVQLEVNR